MNDLRTSFATQNHRCLTREERDEQKYRSAAVTRMPLRFTYNLVATTTYRVRPFAPSLMGDLINMSRHLSMLSHPSWSVPQQLADRCSTGASTHSLCSSSNAPVSATFRTRMKYQPRTFEASGPSGFARESNETRREFCTGKGSRLGRCSRTDVRPWLPSMPIIPMLSDTGSSRNHSRITNYEGASEILSKVLSTIVPLPCVAIQAVCRLQLADSVPASR